MNISSMVSQGYLARNFAQQHKDIISKEDSPTDFVRKLYKFRKDNRLGALKQTPLPSKDGSDFNINKKRENGLFTEQLFSEWDSSLSPDEAIKKLDENLSKIGEYSLSSGLDPREALEHIAAQYTIYKKEIAATGSKAQLESLERLVDRHTRRYAKGLSEVVGGFYEDNGIAGEREHVYNSVLASVKGLTEIYDQFIDRNPNRFNQLEIFTQLTSKSLSNELRRAVYDGGIQAEGHSLDEHNSRGLAHIAQLVKFSENVSVGVAEIKSEEELGVRMGKTMLQALDFLENLPVDDPFASKRHNNAFLDSIRKKTDQHLDKVDVLLNKKATRNQEKGSTEIDPAYAPLDREAVYAVVTAMMADFGETKSISSAVETGKAYGLQRYLSKADVNSPAERYRGSAFWGELAKEALTPTADGSNQYRWIRNLLESKSNSWLNTIA